MANFLTKFSISNWQDWLRVQYHATDLDRPWGRAKEDEHRASRTCTLCGFVVSRKDSMPAHMRRHTGYKPYKCLHCNYSATQKGTLTYHVKVKHPDKSQTI